MRLAASLVVSIAVLSAPAAAQDWEEFRSVEEGFSVNLPGEPSVREFTWTSRLNYKLPAREYTVTRGQEKYSVTVVDYRELEKQGIERGANCEPGNSQCRTGGPPLGPGYWEHDLRGAIVYATNMLLQRDAELEGLYWDWQDVVEGHSLVLTSHADKSVTYAYVAMHRMRLYVFEATVPAGYPEPGLFQQSVGWLNEKGERIRYQGIVYSNSYHGMGVYPVPEYTVQD